MNEKNNNIEKSKDYLTEEEMKEQLKNTLRQAQELKEYSISVSKNGERKTSMTVEMTAPKIPEDMPIEEENDNYKPHM